MGVVGVCVILFSMWCLIVAGVCVCVSTSVPKRK